MLKALDPSIWPMRVKVREYIYYSRKNPRHQQQEHQVRGQHGPGAGQGQGGSQLHHVAVDHNSGNGVPTHNRFEALNAGQDSEQP